MTDEYEKLEQGKRKNRPRDSYGIMEDVVYNREHVIRDNVIGLLWRLEEGSKEGELYDSTNSTTEVLELICEYLAKEASISATAQNL